MECGAAISPPLKPFRASASADAAALPPFHLTAIATATATAAALPLPPTTSGGSMSSMHADSRPASRTVSPRGSLAGSGLTSPRGSVTMAEASPLPPPPNGVLSGPAGAQDPGVAAAGGGGRRLVQPTPIVAAAEAGGALPPPPPQLADARGTSTTLRCST